MHAQVHQEKKNLTTGRHVNISNLNVFILVLSRHSTSKKIDPYVVTYLNTSHNYRHVINLCDLAEL